MNVAQVVMYAVAAILSLLEVIAIALGSSAAVTRWRGALGWLAVVFIAVGNLIGVAG